MKYVQIKAAGPSKKSLSNHKDVVRKARPKKEGLKVSDSTPGVSLKTKLVKAFMESYEGLSKTDATKFAREVEAQADEKFA